MSAGELFAILAGVVLIAGILGVGLVKLRSSAATAREEQTKTLLELVTQHRDELQRELTELTIELDHAKQQIADQARQIEWLQGFVTAQDAIAELTNKLDTHHEAAMSNLNDIKGLLGGRRKQNHDSAGEGSS